MEPNQTQNSDQPQSLQPNGVMMDLLHPQELPNEAPAASGPEPTLPAPQAQVAQPVQAAAPTPPPAPAMAPAVHAVQQVGTTQQPNLALPSAKAKGKGKLIGVILAVLLLLAGAGVAAYFLLLNKPTPVTPVAKTAIKPDAVSNLAQSSSDGVLSAGAVSKSAAITFEFDFETTANTGSLVPEVEIEPIDTHFTDQPTITGDAVAATGHTLHLMAKSSALKDGNYHWQARVRVGTANGPWTAYDVNPFSFAVAAGNVAAFAAPVVESVGGTKLASGKVEAASSRPEFKGTAVAGASITVTIKPEGLSYSSNTDNSGAWVITPSDDLPNGTHQVTVTAKSSAGETSSTDFTLAVNPVAVASTPTPTPTPTAVPSDSPTPTPTPVVAAATPSATPAANLAPTGDPVAPISLIAALVLGLSLIGLWRVSIRHED